MVKRRQNVFVVIYSSRISGPRCCKRWSTWLLSTNKTGNSDAAPWPPHHA